MLIPLPYISIISLFCFILALQTNQKIYWFLLPIVLGISFLTKQAPTGYIFLIIIFSSTIYFIFNFNIKKIILGLFGSGIIISLFLITLTLCEISLPSFVQQYILFPMSLGESRLQFLLPLEFNRIFLRFKLIHLSSMLLLVVCIKEIIKDYKYLRSNEFLILISLIASSYALIIHQLMTINGIFIFFIIPILAGFSHIYFLKYYKNKNYILFLLIFLSISSTIYYGYKYIHNRDFMDLRKVNIKNSVDAEILDSKLSGLKWITPLYPNNPDREISQLSAAIQIIKEDTRVKTIITDYQFISVILSTYDYSPSQVWYGYHVNPNKGDKYYKIYQNFFLNRLKENKVEVVYLVKPLWAGNNTIFEETINHECYKKNNLTEILDIYVLLKCEELMS